MLRLLAAEGGGGANRCFCSPIGCSGKMVVVGGALHGTIVTNG